MRWDRRSCSATQPKMVTREGRTGYYPGLTVEDIRACVAYAKDILAEERIFPAAQGCGCDSC